MAARHQPLKTQCHGEIKNPLKHHRNGPCSAVNQLTHTQVSLLILVLIYANFGPTPRELLARQLIRATRRCGSCSSDDQDASSNIMLMCTHSCINCFSIKVPSILLAVCLINVRIVYLREWKAETEKKDGMWVSAGWEIHANISCQSIWPPVTPDWPTPTPASEGCTASQGPWHFSFAFHFLTLSMSFASIKCVCAKTWKLSFECFNYTPS